MWSLSGCQRTQNQTAGSNVMGIAGIDYNTYTDQGIFSINGAGILTLKDAESMSEFAICDKAGCAHQDESCYAYFGALTYAAVYDDHLLVLSGYGTDTLNEMNLYQTDVNGSNRKKLAQFSNLQVVQQVQFTDQGVVVAYVNTWDENYEQLEKRCAGIMYYDLAAGTVTQLWSMEAHDAFVTEMAVHEQEVYFSYSYRGDEDEKTLHREIREVSLADGSEKLVCEVTNENTTLAFLGDELAYRDEDQMKLYDVVTGEVTSLQRDLTPVHSFDGTFICREWEGEEALHYYTLSKEHSLKELGTAESDLDVQAVFPDYTYAMYYGLPSGNGLTVAYRTEDFSKGTLGAFSSFKDQNGEEAYSCGAVEEFVYDPTNGVVAEGVADTPEEAFLTVLTRFDHETMQDITCQKSVEQGKEKYIFCFHDDQEQYTVVVVNESSTYGDSARIESVNSVPYD